MTNNGLDRIFIRVFHYSHIIFERTLLALSLYYTSKRFAVGPYHMHSQGQYKPCAVPSVFARVSQSPA